MNKNFIIITQLPILIVVLIFTIYGILTELPAILFMLGAIVFGWNTAHFIETLKEK